MAVLCVLAGCPKSVEVLCYQKARPGAEPDSKSRLSPAPRLTQCHHPLFHCSCTLWCMARALTPGGAPSPLGVPPLRQESRGTECFCVLEKPVLGMRPTHPQRGRGTQTKSSLPPPPLCCIASAGKGQVEAGGQELCPDPLHHQQGSNCPSHPCCIPVLGHEPSHSVASSPGVPMACCILPYSQRTLAPGLGLALRQ